MTAPRPPGRVWVSTGHAHIEVNYADGRVLLHPPSVAVPPDAVPQVRAVTSPSWGTSELDAVLPPAPQAPWHWKAAALPATVATAAVLLCGRRHRRLARLARLTAIGHRLPAADTVQATHAVRAARWAARLLPVRWACLEESVTAALALAVAGRGAHWRHGVATDPVRLHAWLASPDGTPVEEPPSTGAYTITHTVRPPRRTP
ncbi:lasso peptide biosynthesis B2 protein [Streptomyces koyangensis]|uniref:Lasso peptide biosynthesis B2 protein n=1 Tax=Streptomyces koyangensis TaxID=188770 RepID=A0ABX7EFW2_9ACTN|nr:lasso peptide biosynthesis B2 protein [Streptomyces koyangensis]QRF03659.1 lasso peptide biosynthesis B2 protein [Streptomyces koyangensis]